MKIKFRIATINDSELMFSWRNDYTTRIFSHNTNYIKYNDHLKWLIKSILNLKRNIWIAEVDYKPIGIVRTDIIQENEVKISWIIDPNIRGYGFGKKMVKTFIDTNIITGNFIKIIHAEIKLSNKPSLAVAYYIGMTINHISNNIYFFKLNLSSFLKN